MNPIPPTTPPPAGNEAARAAEDTPSEAVLAEAAKWYAELRDGRASAARRKRWKQWHDAAIAHQIAWQQVQAVSGSFAPIRELPDPADAAANLEVANQRLAQIISRRNMLLNVALFAGTGTLGWAVWRHELLPATVMAWAADYRTGTGERREITLADGGQLWLNTASAIDVDYSATQRRVVLRNGEILVDTAADAQQRPFVVDGPHGRLRALGTRFGVRLDGATTELAVYEGSVEIRTFSDQTATLQAGQSTRFTSTHIEAIEATDAATQAWTQGVLIAHDMPLGEVIEELRRYRRGQIVLAPGLEQLKVYGSFPLDNTDQALTMLTRVLKLRLRRSLPWRVSIERG